MSNEKNCLPSAVANQDTPLVSLGVEDQGLDNLIGMPQMLDDVVSLAKTWILGLKQSCVVPQ